VGQQRQNTGRRIGGPCTSEGAGHRVRRTELTRTDVGVVPVLLVLGQTL